MKKETQNQFIYVLKDKATDKVFYVGCTQNPKRRQYAYKNKALVSFADTHPVCKYILENKIEFEMEVIHECQFAEWEFWETFYISNYKKEGGLLNVHPGGTCRQGELNPAYGKQGYWKGKKGTATGRKRSQEELANQRLRNAGEGNPCFGTTFKGRQVAKQEKLKRVKELKDKGLTPYKMGKQLNIPTSTLFGYLRIINKNNQ